MKPRIPRKTRLALKASPRAEARYVQDLRRILQGVHTYTTGQIHPLIHGIDSGRARHDASVSAVRSHVGRIITSVIAGLKVHIAKHVGEAFDRMSAVVNKRNLAGMKVLGITPRSIGAEDVLKRARDANIKLVEDAGRAYAEQVRAIFDDEDNFGFDTDVLKTKLLDLVGERGSVSESRAQLIARDQTLKTNAALTRDRAKKAGANMYEWSGSLDERERPMHRELEGTRHSWDDPPVTNEDGDTNNPGDDYQCRCVAIAVFDDEPDDG